MRQCKICNSSNLGLFLTSHLFIANENEVKLNLQKDTLLKCENCGFIFLEDFSITALEKEYQNNYYLQNFKREEHVLYLNQLRLNKINFFINKNISVLDIGCGKGYILFLLKKKVKSIFGTEINNASVLNLKKENFEIYNNFEEINRTFDLITIYHVLEHVPEPVLFLDQAQRILSVNGKIVIEVPNIDSFGFRKNKEKWFYLQKEHLCYFNEKSLEKLLKDLNLRIVKKYKFGGFIVTKLNYQKRKSLLSLPSFLKQPLIFMYFKFCDIFNLHDFIGYVVEKEK